MAEHEVEVTLTARDDASEAVDELSKKIDRLPDEAEVEVTADTREGESRIERFEREVSDLTDDARELRVVFRSEQLQREIRGTLRQLESLEDPVQIEAATRDLERAQGELRELAELAEREYSIEINADPQRTARRAADDLDGLRTKGEGLQSAVPALRGFTDELGGVAGGAGIASQAVADLGDTALIFGERFSEGGRISRGLTRFGTALSGLALGGVVIGGAIAGVSALQAIIGKFRDEQKGATDELLDFQEALADQRFDAAASKLIEQYGDLISEGERLGFSEQQVLDVLLGNASALGSRTSATEAATESSRDFTAEVGRARTEIALASNEYGLNQQQLDRVTAALRSTATGTDTLRGSTDNLTSEQRKNRAAAEAQSRATAALADDIDDAAEATDSFDRELAAVLGEDNYREATIRLGEAFDEFRRKAAEGFETVEDGQLALIDLRREVAEYATEVLGLPPEVVTEVLANLDPNNVAAVEAELRRLAATREALYIIRTRFDGYPGGGGGTQGGPRALPGIIGPADGISTLGARSAGPVLGSAPRGGSALTVNVNTTATMRQVDAAIRRWQRLNGSRRY